MPIKNIKSTYFIQKLFEYIYEDIKLKLVVYNKNIQKILDINIINYKFMSGKYIVYESNGLAKEYNSYNDELIFKGEYLNRKRNGKGEEYEDDKLVFSGEYLNSKRNGIGKEYYEDILMFEGEYLNGKKWNGKGYSKNGNIIYELKDGNGLVKGYDRKNGILFIGFYKNGEKNGKGEEYKTHDKSLIFEGEYYYGRRWNGKKYDDEEEKIILKFENGKGYIKTYYRGNLFFEGEILNGQLNGTFKNYDLDNNLEIEGEHLNGKKNGKIKKYKNSKLTFDGEYLYGHKKRGKEYIKGILEYEGEYLYDKKWNGKGFDKNGNITYELINGNGKVKEYNEFEELIFEGEYLDGKRNGKGKEYSENHLNFEGEYLNGKRNGKGTEYNYEGKVIFEGEYLNGKIYNGKGKEYNYDNGLLEYEFEYKNFEKLKERRYKNGKLLYDMEYINGKLNEIGYDDNGNINYQIINGNGTKIDYNYKGEIIFEGTYLNGKKWNGKTSEDYNGYGDFFIGEYINGKLNGEEFYEGELIFKGEYLNEKMWNGYRLEMEYNTDAILFEGEILNGKRWNGYGREYGWFNELEFEGKYINGKKIPKQKK